VKRRVLLVDDEEDALDILSDIISRMGYEVHTAATGRLALEKAGQAKPDLMLLDLQMPDMNGFEVLKAIREAGMDFPVVMLTARREEQAVEAARALGVSTYLTKPVQFGEIKRVLASALGEAS